MCVWAWGQRSRCADTEAVNDCAPVSDSTMSSIFLPVCSSLHSVTCESIVVGHYLTTFQLAKCSSEQAGREKAFLRTSEKSCTVRWILGRICLITCQHFCQLFWEFVSCCFFLFFCFFTTSLLIWRWNRSEGLLKGCDDIRLCVEINNSSSSAQTYVLVTTSNVPNSDGDSVKHDSTTSVLPKWIFLYYF